MPNFIKLLPNPELNTQCEWAIVELQGDLQSLGRKELFKQSIGDLHYNKYGQPILIIGHHILHGSEQILDKPFAVLQKSNFGQMDNSFMDISNTQSTLLDNTVAIDNKTRQISQYNIIAICIKKLVFKARPKPIIFNIPKKKLNKTKWWELKEIIERK